MRVLVVLALLAATGCVSTAPPTGAASATVTGTVTYRPRIALPPDAVVTVRLLDVSLADAPSVTLAERVIRLDGRQVPVPYALVYDPSRIELGRRYAVRAEIRDGQGALRWTTDTMIPVLTSGAPSEGVEVRVVQVTSQTGGAGRLVGPEWRLTRIGPDAAAPIALDPSERYTVTFQPDGRYTGQADCNRYGGAYAETGGAMEGAGIEVSPGVSTLAACAPPSYASPFLDVLFGATHYTISQAITLRLEGAAGFVELVRADATGMPPQPLGESFTYACDAEGGAFEFTIRNGPGEIALWLPARFASREGGTYRVLGQVRSADGAKYQDGPVTVWTRGADEALLEVDGETFAGCRRVPS